MPKQLELQAGPELLDWLAQALVDYADAAFGGGQGGECDQAAQDALKETAERLRTPGGATLNRRAMPVYRAAVQFALQRWQQQTGCRAVNQRDYLERAMSGSPCSDREWFAAVDTDSK